MPSEYCPHCQKSKNMRVDMYRREEINQDGDKIQIETTSFHCEDCNIFIDSEDVIVDAFRKAKVDRRKKDNSTAEKSDYNGQEKRSGMEITQDGSGLIWSKFSVGQEVFRNTKTIIVGNKTEIDKGFTW